MASPTTVTRGPIRRGDYIPWSQKLILGAQHTFTMFGATVLVPLLTGLNITVALFTAGICTLLFHYLTKKKVPIFMGSSFAFIAPIILVGKEFGGLQYAQGGVIVAGICFMILAGIIKIGGPELIHRLFPPVVTGPIIMVIGLNLAPVAVQMASKNWLIAMVVLAVAAATTTFAKGFLKLVPVITGLVAGYLLSIAMGLIDFTKVAATPWLGIPQFTPPLFSLQSILIIAPLALVVMVEHVGDVLAVQATVEEDFVSDPGIHRTLFADGACVLVAGMIGGPPGTTYSENTGVLALTKVWEPQIMRIAAVFAILMAFIQKIGAVLQTIPEAVMGGVTILLFGMIASVGVRTVVENRVDFTRSRNLIIASIILVLGIGGAVFQITPNFKLAGMSLAALIGLVVNQILPKDI